MHAEAFHEMFHCCELTHLALKPGKRPVTLQVALGVFSPVHCSLLCTEKLHFPLPALGTIFQFTVCRAAGISQLVQEARITFLPFIHPGVPTHFVVALFEALLGLDLYGPMDGFFAAA